MSHTSRSLIITQEGLTGFLKYFDFLLFIKELQSNEALVAAICRKSEDDGGPGTRLNPLNTKLLSPALQKIATNGKGLEILENAFRSAKSAEERESVIMADPLISKVVLAIDSI